MRVSVLVCTRNRPQDFVWALPSVLKNIYSDYEVVVVDQSDDQETAKIATSYLVQHKNLRYVQSDTRGLSAARNLAMSLANGEIIAFTDDDCETRATWVAEIAHLFASEPDVDMMFGQVHMPANLPGKELAVPCLYFEKRRVLRVGEIFGMGANMAFRRSLLDKIGGYDDILGPGAPLACSDDFDFSYRAQLAGARVIADPTIVLVHRAYRDVEQWRRVRYLYGMGNASFFAKHARCGDAWAMRQLWGSLISAIGRHFAKRLLGHHSDNSWIRGYWNGIRMSRHYAVDTRKRLYIATGKEDTLPASCSIKPLSR